MDEGRRRRRIEPTDDWEQLELLCRWPEQVAYEEIRTLVLFGDSVADRARVTGSAERTLYRKVSRFGSEGMDSLFACPRHPQVLLSVGGVRPAVRVIEAAPPTALPTRLGAGKPKQHYSGGWRRRINPTYES